jgi:DNA-binding transcriptional regulator YiaG
MANIGALLKSEISRLSRREIRKEVLPLRRSAAAHRREIAALKRTIAALDRRAKSLAKVAAARPDNKTEGADKIQTRFVAKGLVSLRKRLDLSAADLARLLGVSMQSVYNWEHKKATPRKEQVTSIAALRSIGKKEARQRLDASARQPEKKARKKSRAQALTKNRAQTSKISRRRR